jgi:hypothetical protein
LFVLVQPTLINPSTSRANRLCFMDENSFGGLNHF